MGEREAQEVKEAMAKEGVDKRVPAGVCVVEASDPQSEGVRRGVGDELLLPLPVAAGVVVESMGVEEKEPRVDALPLLLPL